MSELGPRAEPHRPTAPPRATVLVALLAASLGIAPEVGAQIGSGEREAPPTAPAELDLWWEAPPGCPERDEVLDRIRTLAGSSLDETEGLSARGRITPVDGRFRLTLLVPDGAEVRQRVIESNACADLAGAAAVSLALLMGLELRETETPTDEPAAAPPSATRGEPNVNVSDEERSDDRERRRQRGARWAPLLRAPIFAADVGPLPWPSPGAGLGAGAQHGSWRLLFTGVVWAPQRVAAPGQDESIGADVQRLTGRFVACRGWRSGRFEVTPCLALALEYATARGFGENVSSRSPRAVWPAPGADVVAYGRASRSLAVFMGAHGTVELARPRIDIDGIGNVTQLAPAAVGATVGLEWVFQRVAGGETTAIVKDNDRAMPASQQDHLGVGPLHPPHHLK